VSHGRLQIADCRLQIGRASRLTLALLLLALLLAGCAAPPVEDDDGLGRGNATPEGVVASFLDDLNAALADPNLADAAVRRSWAERLAGFFAPSERADQRQALGAMLAGFADSAARPAFGTRVQLEVSYTTTELLERSGDEALVGVVDGVVTLRWLDDDGEVVRERAGALTELIGQASGGLPVLRVGPSWFLTEG
jgi:hypothetical protein